MTKEIKKKHRGVTVLTIIFSNICIALGVTLHFLYDWTGGSFLSALVSGVNESTWEHLKLLFIPFFFMTIIEYLIYGRKFSAFFSSKLLAVLMGMSTIVILFYTYTGVLGRNVGWMNIAIYIFAAISAYTFAAFRTVFKGEGDLPLKSEIPSIFAFVLITAIFFVFTFKPPHIGLFLDPITKTYGIM